MYEQRDTFVPRKHHADYRDRGNWGTTKTRNVPRVVYIFKHEFQSQEQLLMKSVSKK